MITPEQLRQCALCVYLAAEAGPADDISNHLNKAADAIEELALKHNEARTLLRRCQHAFSKMRTVDKYHLLYGEDDSVEQIEADIKAIFGEKP